MPKGGGKGKISNDLVAASCAAVLAVYAAGYSRTREAARKFETQAGQGRLVVKTPSAQGIGLQPARIEASAPAPQAHPEPDELVASAPETLSLTGPPSPVARPKPVRHVASAAIRVPAQSPPTAADGAPSSPGAPPAIAAVPLPEEIASASPAVIASPGPAAVPAAKWRDGVYTGVGDSPHGDIEARVVIKNGRIIEAGIATCNTRYPCSVIDSILHQPVVLQSPIVDYVSHATESSYAYYFGLVDALRAALEEPPAEAAVAK